MKSLEKYVAAMIPMLVACGGEPIYTGGEGAGGSLSTASKIQSYLDGKSLVMEGDQIPSHPNGYDENVDFGAATQCYMRVTMAPLGGKFTVNSDLGTLTESGCDRTRLSGEASFDSTAALIENVVGEAECFDFTITFAGFGQEGRGRIDSDADELILELFFKDQASGHRCADGMVGDPTVTLNQESFAGDAMQVYSIGG